jgi:hypothetical protein
MEAAQVGPSHPRTEMAVCADQKCEKSNNDETVRGCGVEKGERPDFAEIMHHYCDHCGGTATPADPLRPWDWQGQSILLHGRCEEPWYDQAAQGAPKRHPPDLVDF